MNDFLTRTIDTDPHPAFAVYSTGNLAEVAPPRWSPMSWSLVGDPVERALRGLAARWWPASRWHTGSNYVFVGYFACRPYHNLSAFAHMTDLIPRLDPRELTASYFEGIDPPPAVKGLRPGILERLSAMRRVVRTVRDMPSRLSILDAETHALEAQVRRTLAQPSSSLLGRTIGPAQTLLDAVWSLHYDTTATIIGLRALQNAVGRRVLPWWDEVQPWITRPSELAWSAIHDAAAAHLPHGDFLNFAFYEVADAHEPWSALSGSTTPQPPPSDAARPTLDPVDALWEMIPQRRLAGLPNVVTLVEDMMRAREGSKILAMRTLHTFRQLLPALAGEAALSQELWPYLTIRELLNAKPRTPRELIANQRRELCDAALREPMPDQLVFHTATARDTPPAAPSTSRHGRGVSPGLVSGVVVSRSLEVTDERPRILVCERADVDVQHLLSEVDGLVTARGSALSHVAILVREYGIPAVVGSPLAASLSPGQRISVDGTTGEVNVL
jgi:phosphohistidine swiveling domain-containing protein